MPPLKTTKGANGQTIYHLESDSEGDDDDGVEIVDPPPREGIEVVTL
jgi:hypothetical protein